MYIKGEARQEHGLKFQKFIIEKFNLIEEEGITAHWDARTQDGTPVSIKTAGETSEIIFSDIFRQARMEDERFYLIIGLRGSGKYDLKDTHVMDINADFWKSYFHMDTIEYLNHMLKTAGTGEYYSKADKAFWWEMREEALKMWHSNTENIVSPRFRWEKPDKRTGKCNHRIQCSITRKNFLELFVNNENIKQKNYQLLECYEAFLKSQGVSEIEYKKVTERKTTRNSKDGTEVVEEKITETVNVKDPQAVKEYYDELNRKARAEFMTKKKAKKKTKNKWR